MYRNKNIKQKQPNKNRDEEKEISFALPVKNLRKRSPKSAQTSRLKNIFDFSQNFKGKTITNNDNKNLPCSQNYWSYWFPHAMVNGRIVHSIAKVTMASDFPITTTERNFTPKTTERDIKDKYQTRTE